MASREYDVVVVGAGPNGLTCGIALARAGLSVLIVEQAAAPGGGLSSGEVTLPGFTHDICSAIHPLGFLSPYWRTLPLADHGLEWCHADASVAHPLDNGDAPLLLQEVAATAMQFAGKDSARYQKLVAPYMNHFDALLPDLLAPLRIPQHPFLALRFGSVGFFSAAHLAQRFETPQARALIMGCAAHSILPLTWSLTGAVALIFLLTGHAANWPCARGGSQSIAAALSRYFGALTGTLTLNTTVRRLEELPTARAYVFDTSPRQLVDICGDELPTRYQRQLNRFDYGPGVFKMDFALSEKIPWKNAKCHSASTVHVGGSMEEIVAAEAEVWQGQHSQRPFVLVTQQSHFDSSRAPQGKHTGYAYCHVPSGSSIDMSQTIESQIERFAPGFRDVVLARHAWGPADLERHNPNLIGGAITGGAANLKQFFARPALRLDPYSTPNPKIFICSGSTPPGGGVHGMCGYHASQSVLRRLGITSIQPM